MEMLGLPLEERKKAYAGVDLSSLITKYNQAEKQGDLPTMLALLDIIKAAPKGKTPPMTTVKDDIMAQAMPQPMPQMQPQASVPGFEGAVTALENQQMPVSGMANGGPVMNVMRDGDAYDDQPGRDEYAEGGVVKMFGGGIPPYNVATASMDDLIRFAQFGDPKAGEELTRRQMSGFKFRPVSQLNAPMPQGVTFQQAFPDGKTPRGVPGAIPPPPSPAVTPGAAVPPTTAASPSLLRRGASFLGKRLGPIGLAATAAVPALDALVGTERYMGDADVDPITAMQGTISREEIPGSKSAVATSPAAAPPGAGTTSPPPAAGGAGTPGGPALTSDIFGMLKPKSLTESLAEQTAYRKGLEEKGEIPSYEQLKKEYEEFRTEGKTRAEADRAAAKEAFKENLLLNAALAAPQFLKGRGLDQATARFSEAFAPGAMETAKEKTKAIRQADTAERESQDKFRLAQIDLNKAKRAESLGDYDKARSLSLDSIKTYATAVLDKYKSDAYVAASTGAYDRMLVGKQYDLAEKSLNDLYITPAFKSASPEMKQEMIRVRVQSIFQIRPGIGGLQTNRPPIQNVP
jgi:hypothetical protein